MDWLDSFRPSHAARQLPVAGSDGVPWAAVHDPSCPEPETCIPSQFARCGMNTAPSDRRLPSARRFPIGTEPGLGQRDRLNRVGAEVGSVLRLHDSVPAVAESAPGCADKS